MSAVATPPAEIVIERSYGDDGGWFARGHHEPLAFLRALAEYDDFAMSFAPGDSGRELLDPDAPFGFMIFPGEGCPVAVPSLIWQGYWRCIWDFYEEQSFYHQCRPGRGAFAVTVLSLNDVRASVYQAWKAEG